MAKRRRSSEKRGASSVDVKKCNTVHPVGLHNLGNNCYQNVVVQCVLRDPAFAEYLRSYSGTELLPVQLSALAKTLSSSGPTACLTELNKTTRTYSDNQFTPGIQEDAREYLDFLLTLLHSEMLRENAVFERLFVVREDNEHVCLSCGFGEPAGGECIWTTIAVPIAPGDSVSLGECLDLYLNSELDVHSCNHCGCQNFAMRKVWFSSLPDCVIIHLNRFISVNGVTSKDHRPVSCPVGLNFTPYAAEGAARGGGRYHLRAFITHIGDLPDSGHYVCYCKVDKTWYRFSDSHVTKVPVAELDCTRAYILFYSVANELEQLPPVGFSSDLVRTCDKAPSQEGPKEVKRLKGTMTEEESLKRSNLSKDYRDGQECDGDVNDDDNPLNVVLYEWDGVPGATLDTSDLDRYLVCELGRWLYCRNLRKPARKADMISLIERHIANGESHILWSGVDGGSWLELKRKKIRDDVGEEVIEEPILPITGWRPFPSYDIPSGFNRGKVYEYLVTTHPGISRVVGKRLYVSLTSEDSRPGTEKVLRRAEALEYSDFVHAPADNKVGDRFYFVKAYVRASMEAKRYFVYVVLSPVTGTVLYAQCQECMASACNRCSHVGGLLKRMEKHVETEGYAAVSCTGRARTWGLGTVKKDPGRIIRPEYEKKTDEVRRFNFDPRPTAHARDSLLQEDIHTFIYELQRAQMATGIPQAFLNLLPIRYEDFTLDDEDEDVITELRMQFYKNLRRVPQKDPHLIPGTEKQAYSKTWQQVRSIIFTASIAHRVLGLTSNQAKTNFLREHLWRTKVFEGNAATRYGQRNERTARQEYVLRLRRSDPTVTVEETGLYIKKLYPMLGCSPDGIVTSQTESTKLLEIKCPAVLANADPSDFDIHLTKSQQKNFSLEKKDGQTQLKKTHDHYFQIQMQMDVMKIQECDYVVWSKKGMTIVNVSYDDEFWAPKRSELVSRYMSLLLPEYFLMRIPRGLPVLEME